MTLLDALWESQGARVARSNISTEPSLSATLLRDGAKLVLFQRPNFYARSTLIESYWLISSMFRP
jgi:hypothetical protein